MSDSKKRSKYTIPSSDSDISIHENDFMFSKRTSTKKKTDPIPAHSSRQIRKRVKSLNKPDTMEDHQSDPNPNSSSNYNRNHFSTNILSYLNESYENNFENLENIVENAIHVDDDNEQESNGNNGQTSNIIVENNNLVEEANNTESKASTADTNSDVATNNLPTRLTQTSMEQYFESSENAFQQINSLTENTLDFCIRSKIIYKSSIRNFGTNGKVFDGIVCDHSGEIKVVAFNDEVDRLYTTMNTNETITIKNGNVQISNDKFRSPYSPYEIRLLSTSIIEPYKCTNFKPTMNITKQKLIQIPQSLHGSHVDVEGIVIMDRGVITTISEHTGQPVRRKSLKIKDETAATNITIWNSKIEEIPQQIMNKNIRIRNGKINHYNGNKSVDHDCSGL